MNVKNWTRTLGALLLLWPVPLSAGTETGADFLKIPVGARNVSLGQAYSALAIGPDALNGNVAGIVNHTNRYGLSFSHQNHFLDTSFDQIGLVIPGAMTWGLSVIRLGIPDQQGRDENRTPTGSFGASDMAIGAALARRMGSIQLGTQVKFIRQELAGFQAQGMALDLGFLSPTPYSRLSIGGTVRNLGPKMRFIEEEFNLPLSLSVGAAYRISGPLVLGLDVVSRPYDDQVSVALGTEFHTLNAVTLRAGYLSHLAQAVANNQPSESSRGNVGGLNGLTAGLGVELNTFSVDYAFSQFGELGFTHTFTIGTWFGGPESHPAPFSAIESSGSTVDEAKETPTVQRVIVIFGLPAAERPWWEP